MINVQYVINPIHLKNTGESIIEEEEEEPIEEEENNNNSFWYISGVGLIVVIGFIGIAVIKVKLKKK